MRAPGKNSTREAHVAMTDNSRTALRMANDLRENIVNGRKPRFAFRSSLFAFRFSLYDVVIPTEAFRPSGGICGWPLRRQNFFAVIRSVPTYGHSTSGIRTLPSAC